VTVLRRLVFLAACCAASLSPGPLHARAGTTIAWAWSGAITHDGATVTARVSPSIGRARVVLTPDGGTSGVVTVDAMPDPHGIARFEVRGLAPRTAYAWRVEAGEATPITGRLRTFARGPMDATLAFASCARTGSSSPVFDAIREVDPHLFLHMGDFHYENISRNDPARFRRAYDEVLASPAQSRLYRQVPIVYTWDDHDYGGNNASGASASRPAALEVYRQAVPHYPIDERGTAGIQQAFDIGRVRVIVTDARSQRTPDRQRSADAHTMLGPTQRQWLLDQLTAAADRPLVVWVNTVPWIAPESDGGDDWGSYATERDLVATHLDRLGLTRRLVMLSGDAHMVAMDDGTHSHYGADRDKGPGFVVAHAAPLDRRTTKKGGPYSQGVSRKVGQFGVLRITDSGTTLQAEVTGHDRAGRVIPNMRLVLACDGVRACEVQAPSRP
jgi:hypothetical protein